MRSTTPTLVSLLIALSASHLGCADADAPIDADPVSTDAPARGAGDQEAAPGTPTRRPVDPTSTLYPAPHPGMPTIPRNGGPVLHDPSIVTVTFAGDALAPKLQAFGEQVGDLAWWSTVHAGYGVGRARSAGNVAIAEAPPATLSDDDVERWVTARIGDGTLPAPTDQSIYTLYYPARTTVTLSGAEGGGASCQVFLGYHSTVTVNYGGRAIPVAYAVINRCGGGLDELTVTASHEFSEAATDPRPLDAVNAGYVFLDDNAWTGLGGENADMCAGVSSVTEAGWALTRVWNNASAAAGDQPCLPAPDSGGVPYYNAGIVRDTLAIAPGGRAQTEVDCYAFGPLPGAIGLSARIGTQSPLAFGFDRSSCTNGDRVTMTIAVGAGAKHGADLPYTLLASLGAQSAHLWRGSVHVP